MRKMITAALVVLVAGCATVRQQDLDAWVGVPVEALDTHSFFITVPMNRSITSTGIEVRNYSNGKSVSNCFTNASAGKYGNKASGSAFTTCSSDDIVCNNIFYIKDGKVIEYAPTGRCMTDERVQPEARYKSLSAR